MELNSLLRLAPLKGLKLVECSRFDLERTLPAGLALYTPFPSPVGLVESLAAALRIVADIVVAGDSFPSRSGHWPWHRG